MALPYVTSDKCPMSRCHTVTCTKKTTDPKNAKIAYLTTDKCHTVTLSHCHTKNPKNPKNAEITYLTSKKCHAVTLHCHTKKTNNSKNAKIVYRDK
jgi:hypothetical protein